MLSSDDYLRIQRLVMSGQKVTMEADVKTKFYPDDIEGIQCDSRNSWY